MNQYARAADESKLYNCLHLDPSDLPFSLVLYPLLLDLNTEPDVYVKKRAW